MGGATFHGVGGRPMGTAIGIGPNGVSEEHDLTTCAHCNTAVLIRPGSGTKRGFCRLCYAVTCGKCGPDCTPFMRKVEEHENRMRLRAQLEVR